MDVMTGCPGHVRRGLKTMALLQENYLLAVNVNVGARVNRPALSRCNSQVVVQEHMRKPGLVRAPPVHRDIASTLRIVVPVTILPDLRWLGSNWGESGTCIGRHAPAPGRGIFHRRYPGPY
jgi:hypothetical protein